MDDWHPSISQLTRYVAIEENSAINERISEHLESCPECQAILAKLFDEDQPVGPEKNSDSLLPDANALVERVQQALEEQTFPTSYESIASEQEMLFESFLDNGGMGDVLVYYDTKLARQLVVKTLRHDMEISPSRIQRFRQEYIITSALNLPGVPDVYHSGTLPDGREFFSMRYVDGQNFHQFIQGSHSVGLRFRREDPKSVELLRLFISVCRTIHASHEKQVVHRDLKSKNVLIDRNTNAYVIDWGLAGFLSRAHSSSASSKGSPRLTREGRSIGTPESWAPEQANGEIDKLDRLTDVYGLGAILFELLTNKPLHSCSKSSASRATESIAVSEYDLEEKRIRDDLMAGAIRNPKNHRRDLPNELVSICIQATNPDRSLRYESADALANDVEAWLIAQPVSAHRYSLLEYAQRWVASSPTLVATILVCLSLGGILSGSFALYRNYLLRKENASRAVADASVAENIQTLNKILDMASDVSLPESEAMHRLRSEFVQIIEQGLRRSTNQVLDERTLLATAKLLNQLGEVYFENSEVTKAIQIRQFALSTLRNCRESFRKEFDWKLTEAELLMRLSSCETILREFKLGIAYARESSDILNTISETELIANDKIFLRVAPMRLLARAYFRNWDIETLTAHDEAKRALENWAKHIEQFPEDPNLLIEGIHLHSFIGLCIHKSAKFQKEILDRYRDEFGSKTETLTIAQHYFQRSIELFQRLPTDVRESERGMELHLTVLERRGLSDTRVSRELAIKTFDEAIGIARKFVARYPLSQERKIGLCSLLNSQADQFFQVDTKTAIELRREGRLLLQGQILLAKDRIASTYTLLTTRLARDLYLAGLKEESEEVFGETYDLYGTLHHGEPLVAELVGYAVIYNRELARNEPRENILRLVDLATAYLDASREQKAAVEPELMTWVKLHPEFRSFWQEERIQKSLLSLGLREVSTESSLPQDGSDDPSNAPSTPRG